MRYDAEHKARTREAIVREAAAAMRAEGVERMGVAEVMRRAGLTHGGFYAHFRSKEELVAAAIGHAFEERYARFFASLGAPDPAGSLDAFIDLYLSEDHLAHPAAGCPMPPLAGDLPRLPAEARERFATGASRVRDAIALLLAAGGHADPRPAAASILSEMVGAVSLARAAAGRAQAIEILASTVASVRRRAGLQAS